MCLVNQYNSFPVYTSHVDGVKTLGENVADLGGLSLAWAAYKTLPNTDRWHANFNNDQLFWIYAGQVWCATSTQAAALNQIKVDVHSPAKYRIIGPMSNLPDFANTWNCPASSFMGRSLTTQRCQIWNL